MTDTASAVASWESRLKASEEARNADLATLRNKVQLLVNLVELGDTAEAQKAATAALDFEFDHFGDCDFTAELCEELGLDVSPEDTEGDD